jgi:hypothetical protein
MSMSGQSAPAPPTGETNMTTADAKKKIASFIKDTGNKGLGAEYRATDEKWLFVSYSILDELELPTTEALVNYAEDILDDAT